MFATNKFSRNKMKQLSSKTRKELKNKMAEALSDKISNLSAPLQDILLDDLITAFENRLAALDTEKPILRYFVGERAKVLNEIL